MLFRSRDRKLLLHKKEIAKLYQKVTKEGITIVPLKLYFNDNNKIKVEIATAQGKKLYDKRESLKESDLKRESLSALKDFFKN